MEGEWYPLGFFRHTLTDAEHQHSVFNQELLVTYAAPWHFYQAQKGIGALSLKFTAFLLRLRSMFQTLDLVVTALLLSFPFIVCSPLLSFLHWPCMAEFRHGCMYDVSHDCYWVFKVKRGNKSLF